MSLPSPCCFGKYFFSISHFAEKLTARRAEIASLIAAPQRPHRFAADAVLALKEFISTLSSAQDE
jgi:hypothetical protein